MERHSSDRLEHSSDRLEHSVSKVGQVNQQPRRSYEASFKIVVINAAESSDNSRAATQHGVTECNVRRWRTQKDRLKNANSQRKSDRGPQSGRFQEIDRRVCDYLTEKQDDGMPITRAVIQLKALEIAKELNIPTTDFNASYGWCRRMIQRNGLAQQLGPSLHSDSREKLQVPVFIIENVIFFFKNCFPTKKVLKRVESSCIQDCLEFGPICIDSGNVMSTLDIHILGWLLLAYLAQVLSMCAVYH